MPKKPNEILDKILPYEARAEFCQIFCSLFGQWSFRKKCFWYLLTFRKWPVLLMFRKCMVTHIFSGWMVQKSPKICWRNIWMVPTLNEIVCFIYTYRWKKVWIIYLSRNKSQTKCTPQLDIHRPHCSCNFDQCLCTMRLLGI